MAGLVDVTLRAAIWRSALGNTHKTYAGEGARATRRSVLHALQAQAGGRSRGSSG